MAEAERRVDAAVGRVDAAVGRFAPRSGATLTLPGVYRDGATGHDVCDVCDVRGKICF